jgi:hypothetical protein
MMESSNLICRTAAILAGLFILLGPLKVSADGHDQLGYSEADLILDSAGDLVDVCNIGVAHDHYEPARAFCYGFFEGAIHYDEAISRTSQYVDMVCSPEGTTRVQAVDVFLRYMAANPQYRSEQAIDAIFRALANEWPCGS